MKWTKYEYTENSHRWIITDGLINFSIHQLIDGSIKKELARHPNGLIISPEEADIYATYIVDALNAYNQPLLLE